MPVILTLGDSNTHGTPPMTNRIEHLRHPVGTRWPTVMHEKLGGDWTLIEEGLPGRTTIFPDPLMGAHMDGTLGLRIALDSHKPIDVLTIMLGTNDTKAMFGATPEAITGGIAALLGIAMSLEMQEKHGGFKVLVICPPPVKVQGAIKDVFYGGDKKGAALAPLYADLSAHWGASFMDAGQHISVSEVDGVHFEADAHVTLGKAVAEAVAKL